MKTLGVPLKARESDVVGRASRHGLKRSTLKNRSVLSENKIT